MSASPLSRVGLPAADESTSAPSGNRKAVLGIAGLLAAGLALGASLLLGGGEEDLEGLGAPPAAAAEPAATVSPSPSPVPPVDFPDDSTARDGRDPFAALHTDEGSAGTGGPGAPAPAGVPQDTSVADPGAAAPAVPAVPAPPAAGPGSDLTGAAPESSVSTRAPVLALLRTDGSESSRTAVFTVDGVEQPVEVGGSFGPDGRLLLLSLQQGPAAGGWTAVVQSGQGEPFDVVTGVPVTVP